MLKRTTIELDLELLTRAQRALGSRGIRETVEESLRRVAEAAEREDGARAERQRAFLLGLGKHADLGVLASEAMWR